MKLKNITKPLDITINIDQYKEEREMYQSPIEIVSKVDAKIEEEALKIALKYGISVDAEELKKALAYDRKQYDTGVTDGRVSAIEELREEDPISKEEQIEEIADVLKEWLIRDTKDSPYRVAEVIYNKGYRNINE